MLDNSGKLKCAVLALDGMCSVAAQSGPELVRLGWESLQLEGVSVCLVVAK